jgi:hypothetical protein
MAGDGERSTADPRAGGNRTVANRFVAANAWPDNAIARDDWQHSVVDTSIGDARAAVKRRAVGGLEQRHAIVAGDREKSATDPAVGGTRAVANRFVAGNAGLDNAFGGDDWQYSGLDTSVGNARAAVKRRAVGGLEQRHAIVASDRDKSDPPVGGTRVVANGPYCGVDTSIGSTRAAANRRAGGSLEHRHAIVASDRDKPDAPAGGVRAAANRFATPNAWINHAIAGDDWPYSGVDISVGNACAATNRPTVKTDCKRCFDVVAMMAVAKPRKNISFRDSERQFSLCS